MIKRKLFLSYVKVGVDGLQRVFYRTVIADRSKTVKHDRAKNTSVQSFLEYNEDLLENKNELFPYIKLSPARKQEIQDRLQSCFDNQDNRKKNRAKFVIGERQQGIRVFTYLELTLVLNGKVEKHIYETENPLPAGTLIDSYCIDYALYGLLADGNYGTYEKLIDRYSLRCGYDPSGPMYIILDGGTAFTIFTDEDMAGGGGALLTP